MRDKKVVFTPKLITATIDMFVKCGLGEEAYLVYNEMEKNHNIKPDIIHVNSIVGYLIQNLNIEKVFNIITPYVGTSNVQEEIMWIVLLHSCSEMNDQDKSRRLYQVFLLLFFYNTFTQV